MDWLKLNECWSIPGAAMCVMLNRWRWQWGLSLYRYSWGGHGCWPGYRVVHYPYPIPWYCERDYPWRH